MNKIALAFFTAAPVYAMAGMVWGMQMGATGDHSMHPAHAHLNLLGLVVNGLFGTFYALAAGRYSAKLAWTNFVLWNAGILWMIPLLAMILAGNDALGPLMPIGEIAAVLGMAVFLWNVVQLWGAEKKAAAPQPAE